MSEPHLQGTCPNCGGPIPTVMSYCPNCGSRPPLPARPRGSGATVAFVLLFIFIGLPAGAFGACCLLIASGDATFLALGLGTALLSLLLFVLMIRSMIVK